MNIVILVVLCESDSFWEPAAFGETGDSDDACCCGESGSFVEYGNFDDSGESFAGNLISHFLDISFCGHSNFHFFFTNIISLKI